MKSETEMAEGRSIAMKTTPDQEAKYKTFIQDTGNRCWRCGRTARDRPRWWNGPFLIERAHIDKCNHPRREDRRCCWAACSLCHRIQHGDRFPQGTWPPVEAFRKLELCELLAIKKWVDPNYYDRAFLKTCMVGDPKKLYLPPAVSYLRAIRLSWAVRQIKPNQTIQSSGVPGVGCGDGPACKGDEPRRQEDSRP